ncbi:PIG-L family deacetylase [bacterium]|nr:PIG-L family deacetylase [FCB group bacterium]MBL7190503.1 PIG-L family deacetylase [bacterium]
MNILGLGPHPDDLEFGAGGTLSKFARSGHDVYLMILTKGEYGGSAEVRETEQKEAAGIMGVKEVFWGGYKDTELNVDSDSIRTAEKVIKQINPDIIFASYMEDTHQDHRALSQIALSAARNAKNLLLYETPTTGSCFKPCLFVDIDEVIKLKQRALMAHHSQVMKTNIEDTSIVELAIATSVFRGIQSRVKHAEGFVSVRFFLDTA